MRQILTNKKGMGAGMLAVIVLVGFILVAGAVLVGTGTFSQKTADVEKEKAIKEATGDCQTAPSLSISSVDKVDTGTTVTTVNGARLNGQYIGVVPSSFQIGDNVDLFLNATNYISEVINGHKIEKCGVNSIKGELYATDDPTVRLFNTDGNRIGDAVTACLASTLVNQTASASTISMKMEIQSSPKQSSGDLVVVIEVDNNTEVGYDGISLTGTGVTDGSALSTYTQNATTSTVRAFNVPASTAGALGTYYINLAPKSGQTIGGGPSDTYALVTLYSKQAFIDVDGKFKVGIEDSNGNTKYEDTQDLGICIV